MWIDRKYTSTLQRLAGQFPAVVLTGARQVGKTSLVRNTFPEYNYVSLDLPAAAELAEKNPEQFLRENGDPLIIDEVQYAPSLFRWLKIAIDRDRQPGRFILTGSQNFLLMQNVSDSLAGRCGMIRMFNLSLEELQSAGHEAVTETTLLKGGFPELHAHREMDPSFWYASYLSTYLERDVRNILNVGSLRDFDRFLRACAIRTGQLLSYSELARDVGIAPNTAKQWISVLLASDQIYLLEPYHRNLGKRLIKSPKLYLCDTGLAAFLMGFEKWMEVARHPVIGALWETHMVMEVVKYYSARGRIAPLWFWRTAYGEELDLLIEKGGRFIGMEMKFTETPGKKELKGFTALQKMYGEEALMKGYIACRTADHYPITDRIEAIPGTTVSSRLEEGEA
ncbi:MAG: ATP-binding protein [Desulfobulbaceae bacterium]